MSYKGEPDGYREKRNGCPTLREVLSDVGEFRPNIKEEELKRPDSS